MAARTRLLALAALAAALAACDAPTYPREAPPYDVALDFDTTSGVARFASGSTIAFYVDQTGAPEGYDLAAALDEAMAAWRGITRFGEFTLARTADRRAAQVVVRFRSTPSILDLSVCDATGGGLGRTFFCADTTTGGDGSGVAPVLPYVDGAPSRVKMEVYVDPLGASEFTLQAAGQTRQEFFVTLLTHELGHVLGITGHSSDDDDLMFGGIIKVRRPSRDDGRVLRWVWSQPALLRF